MPTEADAAATRRRPERPHTLGGARAAARRRPNRTTARLPDDAARRRRGAGDLAPARGPADPPVHAAAARRRRRPGRADARGGTLVAVSIGGLVPLLLKRLGRDPALASGPILTTVTDRCGFLTVLAFASALLAHLR
ncbi:MAG: magnesium transporter [Planctomycetes bacterium]|nr:magnesium transporter [Planctomycetota bacterium]